MKLLLIGGTKYVGRHMIEAALDAGHEVTMFNRGVSAPDFHPELERLTGDRQEDAGLAALKGRSWDAVIDTCGYDHRVVQKTLDVLAGNVGHYTFVSSISVYKDFDTPNAEDAPKGELLGDPDVPLGRPYGGSAHYGPLKVLCEEAVAKAFPDRWQTVRLSIGVGPGFIGAASALGVVYWGQRVRDYDTVLVPGPRNRAVDFIDLRDLGKFAVAGAESGRVGAYNMATPRTTIEDALTMFKGVYNSDAELVFADGDWLVEQGIDQNRELPWWINGDRYQFHFGVVNDKAVAAGLRNRPMAESIRDSVEWAEGQATPLGEAGKAPSQAGQSAGYWDSALTRERELELIELWRARTPSLTTA